MVVYDPSTGVSIKETAGSVSGASVGTEQKAVLVGYPDPDNGTANANEVYQVNSRSTADELFGADSQLAQAYRQAIANGANREYIYMIAPELTQQNESVTGTRNGALSESPILPDPDLITFEKTGGGTSLDVTFGYEFPLTTPTESDTVVINPTSQGNAAFEVDTSDDYDIEYYSVDFESAIDKIPEALNEDEFGVASVLALDNFVNSYLDGVVDTARKGLRMLIGVCGVEPNGTQDGNPTFDPASYEPTLDSDYMCMLAAASKDQATSELGDASVLAETVGKFAGTPVEESIYNDSLKVVGNLAQELSRSEAQTARDKNLIPVRQKGTVRLEGNSSTSSEEGWDRDYRNRRVVDRTVLVSKLIGEQIIGEINTEETRRDARFAIRNELLDFQDRNLIRPQELPDSDEAGWFVDVYRKDNETAGIDIGIKPQGVVKFVPINLTVSTN